MSTAIRIESISKQYRLGEIGTGSLAHDVNRWWHRVRGKEDPYLRIGEANDRSKKGESEYVWALRDVSFDIQQGEVVGIIGRNGAGKSTLLKILSRVTSPTTGTIKTRGRIASLLEVGTGFHPELTGRENIYLNGAILGMRKHETTRKLDEIIDFSGCERYIDTPVKRYSSGMMVRLGFAVAAHLDNEILVVDEVLAVGDFDFQSKCIGKMRDISEDGHRTVIYVSHNLPTIEALCTRGIMLQNGGVAAVGSIPDILETYLAKRYTSNGMVVFGESTGSFSFRKLSLVSAAATPCTNFSVNDSVTLLIDYDLKERIAGLDIGVAVRTRRQQPVFISERSHAIASELCCGSRTLRVVIPRQLLIPGHYELRVEAHIPKQRQLALLDGELQFQIDPIGMPFEMPNLETYATVFAKCAWFDEEKIAADNDV